MLEVRSLNVAYGDTQVLWDVSLDVREGEIVALIGSNGAGKTTLLSTISGLMRPRSGEIRFDGHLISDVPTDEIVRRRLVHVPEGRRLFSALTVSENLLLGAHLRTDKAAIRRDLDRVFTLFPILSERQSQLAGKLSGGEQQMCAIGRGLMAGPRLLMIDELSLGLAPIIVERLVDVLVEVNRGGTTLLLVEQDVEIALTRATRGYVLEAGQVGLSGTASDLLLDDEVRRAYLGI
jgi:ABC-type branched-subunit amino acid transport system ATPase component